MSKSTTKLNKAEQLEKHIEILYKALDTSGKTIEVLTKSLEVYQNQPVPYTPITDFEEDFAPIEEPIAEPAAPSTTPRAQHYANLAKQSQESDLTDDVTLDS